MSTIYESRYANNVLLEMNIIPGLIFSGILISRLSNHEKMHVVIITMKMLTCSTDSICILKKLYDSVLIIRVIQNKIFELEKKSFRVFLL